MQQEDGNTYDIVIIGAGISGLTSAALLSKAGLKVCVLELNSQPGGYLAKIEKDGFTFDAAIHWLNNCDSKGFVTKIFKLIGDDHPVATPQKRIKRFIGDNFDYLLTSNPDELKNDFIKDYPDKKRSINRFFSAAKNIYLNLDGFNKLLRSGETMSFAEKIRYHVNRFKFAIPFIKYVGFTGKRGKTTGINLYFKADIFHKDFKNESDLLSCIIPVGWAYNNDFQKPPTGGSHTYPEWLTYIIGYYGNKVIYNARALKILTNNSDCDSIIFEYKKHRHQLFCKQIIAACDMSQVYEIMMPRRFVSPKLLEKLEKADIYSSAFIVYVFLNCPAEDFGFNEEIISFMNDNQEDIIDEQQEFGNCEITVFSQSARDKTSAPPGSGSLTIMIPAWFNSNNRWQTEVDKNGNLVRGEKYKELKKQYAEALITRVQEKLEKDIRKNIIKYEAATPITLWRYTENRLGSMMGIKPGRKNVLSGIAHYKTPVKGVYMSGHWSELGGGVPIAVKASLNAVLHVLKDRNHKAFKLITGYLENKKSLEEVLSSGAFLPYDNSWNKDNL